MNAPAAGPRVLLVDDDGGVREALRRLLVDDGFDIVGEAGDGSEGVAKAEELRPDVILMDMRMPVLGGIEATRLIKELHPGTQVIILTVYDDPALKRFAADAGAYAYVVKGTSLGLVGDLIRQAWQSTS